MLKWLAALAVLFSSVIPAQAQMMTGMDRAANGMVNIPGRWWIPSWTVAGPILQDQPATGATMAASNSSSAMAWCGFATYTGTINNVYWLSRAVTGTNGSVVQQEIDTLSTSASPTQPGSIWNAGALAVLAASSITADAWQKGFPNFTSPPSVTVGQPLCFKASYSVPVSGDSVSFGVNANSADAGMLPGLSSTTNGSTWTWSGISDPNIVFVYADGTYATLAMGAGYTNTGFNGSFANYNSTSTPNDYGARFQVPVQSVLSAVGIGAGCNTKNATMTVELTDDAAPPNQLATYSANCAQVQVPSDNQAITPVPLGPKTLSANTWYHIGAYCTSDLGGANDCGISGLVADGAYVNSAVGSPIGPNFYLSTRTAPSGNWSNSTTQVPNINIGLSQVAGSGSLTTFPAGVYYPGYSFIGPYFQNGNLTSVGTLKASMTSAQTGAVITDCGYVVSYQDGDFAGTKNIQSLEFSTNSSAMTTGSPDGVVQVSIQGESTTANPTQADGNILGSGNAYATEAVGSMTSGGVVTNLGNFGTSAAVTAEQLACVVWNWSSPGTGASFGLGGYPSWGDSGWQPTSTNTTSGTPPYLKISPYTPNVLLKFSDGTYGTLEMGVAGTRTGNFYLYASGSSPNEVGLLFSAPVATTVDQLIVAHTCTDASTTFTLELTDTASTPNQIASTTFNCASAVKLNSDSPQQGGGFTVFPISGVNLLANTNYVVGLACTSAGAHQCQIPYIAMGNTYDLNGEPCGSSCYAATRTGTGSWTLVNTRRPAFQVHFSKVAANDNLLRRAA